MSARPITVSEEIKAKAHPWVNILSLFGEKSNKIFEKFEKKISIRK